MFGLRTQETEPFINYFEVVQQKAKEQDCVFFLESGDGSDFANDNMEGENLQGWLIPVMKANEFEKIWLQHAEDDNWIAFFCWAEWFKNGDVLDVRFVEY